MHANQTLSLMVLNERTVAEGRGSSAHRRTTGPESKLQAVMCVCICTSGRIAT